MPRRELLTLTERVQLFAFPEDEGELIRLATPGAVRPHLHSPAPRRPQSPRPGNPDGLLTPSEPGAPAKRGAVSPTARHSRSTIEGDAGGLDSVRAARRYHRSEARPPLSHVAPRRALVESPTSNSRVWCLRGHQRRFKVGEFGSRYDTAMSSVHEREEPLRE